MMMTCQVGYIGCYVSEKTGGHLTMTSWRYHAPSDWENLCRGDCDLVGPQHFRDDCIFHSPRSTKTARRIRKVQDGTIFSEKVARCVQLLFALKDSRARLVFENQDVDGYVTASFGDFEKCFGVTEVYSVSDGRLIGRASDC